MVSIDKSNHRSARKAKTSPSSSASSSTSTIGGGVRKQRLRKTQTPATVRRNERERNRVRRVNSCFVELRRFIPKVHQLAAAEPDPDSSEKSANGALRPRLSKVETLRAAIIYIRHLKSMLGSDGLDCYNQDSKQLMEPLTPVTSISDHSSTKKSSPFPSLPSVSPRVEHHSIIDVKPLPPLIPVVQNPWQTLVVPSPPIERPTQQQWAVSTTANYLSAVPQQMDCRASVPNAPFNQTLQYVQPTVARHVNPAAEWNNCNWSSQPQLVPGFANNHCNQMSFRQQAANLHQFHAQSSPSPPTFNNHNQQCFIASQDYRQFNSLF